MKNEQLNESNDPKDKKQEPLKTNPINKDDLKRGKGDDNEDKPEPATEPDKEQVTNKDEKVTNEDNKVTNTDADKEGDKLKPGKTTEPDISPEEKKEIKTKIHTSPGNENVPE